MFRLAACLMAVWELAIKNTTPPDMRAASYIAAARKIRALADRIEATANAETPREKQARTRAVNAAAHAARLLATKNAKP